MNKFVKEFNRLKTLDRNITYGGLKEHLDEVINISTSKDPHTVTYRFVRVMSTVIPKIRMKKQPERESSAIPWSQYAEIPRICDDFLDSFISNATARNANDKIKFKLNLLRSTCYVKILTL